MKKPVERFLKPSQHERGPASPTFDTFVVEEIEGPSEDAPPSRRRSSVPKFPTRPMAAQGHEIMSSTQNGHMAKDARQEPKLTGTPRKSLRVRRKSDESLGAKIDTSDIFPRVSSTSPDGGKTDDSDNEMMDGLDMTEMVADMKNDINRLKLAQARVHSQAQDMRSRSIQRSQRRGVQASLRRPAYIWKETDFLTMLGHKKRDPIRRLAEGVFALDPSAYDDLVFEDINRNKPQTPLATPAPSDPTPTSEKDRYVTRLSGNVTPQSSFDSYDISRSPLLGGSSGSGRRSTAPSSPHGLNDDSMLLPHEKRDQSDKPSREIGFRLVSNDGRKMSPLQDNPTDRVSRLGSRPQSRVSIAQDVEYIPQGGVTFQGDNEEEGLNEESDGYSTDGEIQMLVNSTNPDNDSTSENSLKGLVSRLDDLKYYFELDDPKDMYMRKLEIGCLENWTENKYLRPAPKTQIRPAMMKDELSMTVHIVESRGIMKSKSDTAFGTEITTQPGGLQAYLRMKNQAFMTIPFHHVNDAKWYESFQFFDLKWSDNLEVVVRTKMSDFMDDPTTETCIGQLTVPIVVLKIGEPVDAWFPLTPHKEVHDAHNVFTKGEVRLQILLSIPFGTKRQREARLRGKTDYEDMPAYMDHPSYHMNRRDYVRWAVNDAKDTIRKQKAKDAALRAGVATVSRNSRGSKKRASRRSKRLDDDYWEERLEAARKIRMYDRPYGLIFHANTVFSGAKEEPLSIITDFDVDDESFERKRHRSRSLPSTVLRADIQELERGHLPSKVPKNPGMVPGVTSPKRSPGPRLIATQRSFLDDYADAEKEEGLPRVFAAEKETLALVSEVMAGAFSVAEPFDAATPAQAFTRMMKSTSQNNGQRDYADTLGEIIIDSAIMCAVDSLLSAELVTRSEHITQMFDNMKYENRNTARRNREIDLDIIEASKSNEPPPPSPRKKASLMEKLRIQEMKKEAGPRIYKYEPQEPPMEIEQGRDRSGLYMKGRRRRYTAKAKRQMKLFESVSGEFSTKELQAAFAAGDPMPKPVYIPEVIHSEVNPFVGRGETPPMSEKIAEIERMVQMDQEEADAIDTNVGARPNSTSMMVSDALHPRESPFKGSSKPTPMTTRLTRRASGRVVRSMDVNVPGTGGNMAPEPPPGNPKQHVTPRTEKLVASSRDNDSVRASDMSLTRKASNISGLPSFGASDSLKRPSFQEHAAIVEGLKEKIVKREPSSLDRFDYKAVEKEQTMEKQSAKAPAPGSVVNPVPVGMGRKGTHKNEWDHESYYLWTRLSKSPLYKASSYKNASPIQLSELPRHSQRMSFIGALPRGDN